MTANCRSPRPKRHFPGRGSLPQAARSLALRGKAKAPSVAHRGVTQCRRSIRASATRLVVHHDRQHVRARARRVSVRHWHRRWRCLNPTRNASHNCRNKARPRFRRPGVGGPSANLRPSAQRTAPTPAVGIDANNAKQLRAAARPKQRAAADATTTPRYIAPGRSNAGFAAAVTKRFAYGQPPPGVPLRRPAVRPCSERKAGGLRRVAQATRLLRRCRGHDWQAAMTKRCHRPRVAMRSGVTSSRWSAARARQPMRHVRAGAPGTQHRQPVSGRTAQRSSSATPCRASRSPARRSSAPARSPATNPAPAASSPAPNTSALSGSGGCY